jgi:hypothetical protein
LIPVYLLDANVFIEPRKRDWYAMDISPGYWQWLDDANLADRVHSVERVYEELKVVEDEVYEWARDRRDRIFLKPDEATIASFVPLTNWAQNAGYSQGAVDEFLAAGDFYLVGHAHAHGLAVVTFEVKDRKDKIKVPEACEAMNVPCISLFDLLRSEGVKFGLV